MHQMHPAFDYGAVARIPTGWQGEYAGCDLPSDWELLARKLTGADQDEAAFMHDSRTGQTRVAFSMGGVLKALCFVGPKPVAVARTHATGLIGTQTPPLQALAGRAGTGQADPGPIVCACFNIGSNTLRSAISDGAMTIEALGAATCAGTNCGSCKPELAALLSAAELPIAAE